VRELVQVVGGHGGKRVWESKYYVLMYENGKVRHVEIIPRMGEGR
jgi:hypothetical protein